MMYGTHAQGEEPVIEKFNIQIDVGGETPRDYQTITGSKMRIQTSGNSKKGQRPLYQLRLGLKYYITGIHFGEVRKYDIAHYIAHSDGVLSPVEETVQVVDTFHQERYGPISSVAAKLSGYTICNVCPTTFGVGNRVDDGTAFIDTAASSYMIKKEVRLGNHFLKIFFPAAQERDRWTCLIEAGKSLSPHRPQVLPRTYFPSQKQARSAHRFKITAAPAMVVGPTCTCWYRKDGTNRHNTHTHTKPRKNTHKHRSRALAPSLPLAHLHTAVYLAGIISVTKDGCPRAYR